jgi:hypothetical protein
LRQSDHCATIENQVAQWSVVIKDLRYWILRRISDHCANVRTWHSGTTYYRPQEKKGYLSPWHGIYYFGDP